MTDVSYIIVDLTTATELTVGAGNDVTITTPTSGYVTGGQVISIKANSYGSTDHLIDNNKYRFTLSYTPTGGSMGTVTWVQ